MSDTSNEDVDEALRNAFAEVVHDSVMGVPPLVSGTCACNDCIMGRPCRARQDIYYGERVRIPRGRTGTVYGARVPIRPPVPAYPGHIWHTGITPTTGWEARTIGASEPVVLSAAYPPEEQALTEGQPTPEQMLGLEEGEGVV